MGGLYCLTMAKKRKKKECHSERVAFLEMKGKEFAADLTKKATKWELAFKKKLEAINIGFIFQHPVICNKRNLFILDFYLPQINLAIELDGQGHYTPSGLKYDRRRTSCLKKEGISVLRFQNYFVEEITIAHLKELLDLYVSQTR